MVRRIFFAIAALSALAKPAFCDEPQRLDPIVVTPSYFEESWTESGRSITVLDEEDLALSSYDSLGDTLGALGGIDIRRRGPEGVQSDISIRGATFDQNTVLIDGIPVNDPQTGHHTMDIALTAADIERVEIMKGPGSSLYGANSFGGVINIITKKPDDKKIIIEATGGAHEYFSSLYTMSYPLGPIKNRFSLETRQSSGYMPDTAFDMLSISDSASIDTALGEYNFLFGYTKKDFGAANFYSNNFPNEEEHTDTRFFKIDGEATSGSLTIKPKLFLRRHWDKFILEKNRPGWQTNYHTTYSYGGGATFLLENPFLDTAYGFELSQDTIDSTNLSNHFRNKAGAYLEVSPHISDDLHVTAGLREDYFSDFGLQWSPSAKIAYTFFDHYTVRSSVGRSYRIPTFTDLYYRDAANIGDPNLQPESSWSYDVGLDCAFDGLTSSATFFRRYSYDTIDWTRLTASDPWRISNTGDMTTSGFEAAINVFPKKFYKECPVGRAFVQYTVLDMYRKHDYLSKYVSDYLKQHISSGIEFEFFGFRNAWILNYKKRVGDKKYLVADMKLSKEVNLKGGVSFEVFFEVENLFDVRYSEQSDVMMPGRWIRSGGRFEF